MGTYRRPELVHKCLSSDRHLYINVTPGSPRFVYQIYLESVCLGFFFIITILYSPPRLSLSPLSSPRRRRSSIWHSSSICIMCRCRSVRGAFNSLPYDIIIYLCTHMCGYICSRTQKTVLYSRRRLRYPTPRGEPIFYSRGRPCSGENRDGVKNAVMISEIPFAEVTRPFFPWVRRVVSIYIIILISIQQHNIV